MAGEFLIEIAARHQAHLERLKAGEVKKFEPFLQEIDGLIRDQLSRDITQYSRTRLESMLEALSAAMGGVYADFEDVWRESVTSAATYEADFELRALGQVVDGVEFAIPPESQIIAAVMAAPLGDIDGINGGSLLEAFYRDMTAASIKKIESAIRSGYATGQTTPQILQRIRGTRAAKYKDGLLASVNHRDIETIVRTSLQHASAQAREAVWAANADIIAEVEIVAVLDAKTSRVCRSLDGRRFKIGEGPRPPFHPRCRTSERAVLDKKYSLLERGMERVARDPGSGEVYRLSAKKTYYGWLKDQPAAVQDSIIGPTRGALLRSGGLTVERFTELQLDRNFEPVTLEKMREFEPAAFERAGI
jgi:SPP1 gp7 family putative phage head morphogenesis protein